MPRVRSHSVISGSHVLRHSSWRGLLITQFPLGGWRTRFAPAPTGYLHLGHLVNAVYVWGLARVAGGDVVLRIEDHDRSRCRAAFEQAILDDLEWLGLESAITPVRSFRPSTSPHPQRQSDHPQRYADALAQLESQELVYPCVCSRRDIAAQGEPAAGDESRYAGTCRNRHIDPSATPARRVRLSDDVETFIDLRLGSISQQPSLQCGDVLVRDRLGQWTYQFAVTVDDAFDNIDVIIRGEDLLASTGRQRQLARLLGREPLPLVLHHPLVVHEDGRKLSKSSNDTSLRDRRAAGASAATLLGEAAWLAGLQPSSRAIAADDLAQLFDDTTPRG